MKRSIVLAIASLLTVSSTLYAQEFYVSPSGRDTNSGEKENPLASLDGARIKIASEKLAGKEPVTVWVQGGTYHLDKAFHLGAEDSGTAKAPITYRAVPGEEVLLKGSLPLSSNDWKLWKDGISMQSLHGTALEGKEINQLFMSDKRMVRARFPNWDYDNPLRTGTGYLHATNKKSMEMLSFESLELKERAARWTSPQTGIVHAFHAHNWGNFQFRIKDLDLANNTIHFGEGGWQAQRRYGVGAGKSHGGSPFYIDNVFEELDAPFEWFHDVKTDTLYFKPPAGTNLKDVSVEAAVASRIIECVGAEHIHFDGFHLTQTRTTFMDAYDDIARGDWAVHRGGAVYFKNSQNCSVSNFHIEQVGGNGIFVDGFNREIHVTGCLVEETGESAVCFVGNPKAVREYQTWEKAVRKIVDVEPGPKTKDYPANCSVKNAITRDVGIYGKQTSGVLVSMAMDITIDHCSVYRIARAGVTLNDGTWGGHVMSHCDIYDTILDTGEHGPFNAWGRERFWNGRNLNKEQVLLDAMKPVKLHNNRVGNYRSGVSAGNWTIDLDDGSSNFQIYNNLMLGSTLKLRDGYYREVQNNIMVSAVPIGLHCWPADNSEDVFERNIVVVSGAVEGSKRISTGVIGSARMPEDYGSWGRFDSNIWWNTNAKDFSAGNQVKSLAQWQEKQGENDVFADPLFVDPENRNYKVKADSPALKLGFKNFPMDQFGHQMTRVMCGSTEFEDSIDVVIRADARGGEVRYSLDGSVPTVDSPLYSRPLSIGQTTTLIASSFDANGHEVGFADKVTLKKVDAVVQQSWLASLLAGKHVGSAEKTLSTPASSKEPRSWNWVGMELVTISDFPDFIDASGGQSFGAFVVKLDADSPAAEAGLKNGDTIVRVGSTKVQNLEDLKRALTSATGAVAVKVFRDYKHYEYTLLQSSMLWTIDTQAEWEQSVDSKGQLEIKDGMATPTAKTATFRSTLKTFDDKRSAESITIAQSPVWQNWNPIGQIGPKNVKNAPVFLRMGEDDYWLFAGYKKSKDAEPVASATLEGFDVPLMSTKNPHLFIAPGGVNPKRGGYYGWQSRDMVNWVFHGPMSPPKAGNATTAELVDGKVYLYYDYPNDQDPHLAIDADLTDGEPGVDMGMAFLDPSHGSDCAVIRDLDGNFHLIVEDWSPIDASTHAWDSPLATHAVSKDGKGDFKMLPPAVDERTKPTGKMGEYFHPHWHRGARKDEFPAKPVPQDIPRQRIKKGDIRAFAEYEIHEPEQNAFGDWAAISIGGQYYLFGDFDPATAHGDKNAMSVAWFTSSDINEQFTFCGNIGAGHPDPDIMFAEDKFYLITQTTQDFVSTGPWVEGVAVRVGVDSNKDGAIDQWTDWQTVKETYGPIPGFAKQVAKTPAQMDLSGLPKGYGFQFEVRLTDTTENESKPIIEAIEMNFR
ncbi:PDZ domain-containing protein [Neorhodopirellula lusitana]|uniref:PDZ domain-containing protein n=1 Tax=Neorhodopirellula lusitana TaxID=445327 RepID=A0ABY1PT68_9BACT|nr:chitobiase/beta-hexosaminidase C-terminal domain-containing protein [Neorhodopirellula lusitana]SMP43590.1 PDZ domain-containing protein [Neorhodopirellula lusitana]